MKCSNCGFTYDNEAVCPICGVPAYPAEQAAPYYMAAEPVIGNTGIPETPARQTADDAPKAKKEPVAAKSGKGLKIATLCVLAVIAATLIASVVFQILAFSLERKYYDKAMEAMDRDEQLYDDLNKISPNEFLPNLYSDLIDPTDFEEPDGNDYIAPKTFTDSAIRKTGEAYDFEYGSITLQSIKLTGASGLDKNKQTAAFTVTVKNTTDQTLKYLYPSFSVGDNDFDSENYLYDEYENGEGSSVTIQPNQTLTAVYYYSLPKENQTLDCSIHIYCMGENEDSDGSEYEFSAHTAYEFETKDVK